MKRSADIICLRIFMFNIGLYVSIYNNYQIMLSKKRIFMDLKEIYVI